MSLFTQCSEINWQYVFYKQYNVLGMENVERTDNEPIVYCHRKTFRKQFIKNGNNGTVATSIGIKFQREQF